MHIYSKMQFQRIHRTSESHQWAFLGLRAIKDPGLQNFIAFPKEENSYLFPLHSKLKQKKFLIKQVFLSCINKEMFTVENAENTERH